ncbi:MAG: hypothetical protein RL398_661 [Planctomycetota bacterium]|jgi:type II secretory pathway component PulF
MRFQSQVLERDGSTAALELEAVDAQSLHEDLHRQGRVLLRAKPVARERASIAASGNVRLTPRSLLLFTQALRDALDAGVPLLTAFSAIAEQSDEPERQAMLETIGRRVAGGNSLAESLQEHPRAFPSIYCALVRAGEQSGSLPQVLESLAEYLEWRIEITATVRQAMVYPLVVAAAGYGMILFLLTFVVPRIAGVLDKLGGELPAASRWLLAASDFLATNLLGVLAATAAAIVLLVQALRRDTSRAALAGIAARAPLFGPVLVGLSTAQFCRTFGVLLQAGLGMPQALDLTASAIGVKASRERVRAVHDHILGGARLGESVAQFGLLPPVALSMVRVGEEAGRLPTTFARLGRLYDREVKEQVKRALTLLEPIVTVALGLVVGGVAVIVIATIYSALQGIGK